MQKCCSFSILKLQKFCGFWIQKSCKWKKKFRSKNCRYVAISCSRNHRYTADSVSRNRKNGKKILYVIKPGGPTTFSISSFFRGPRRKELGGKEATEMMTRILSLIFRKSQVVSKHYIHASERSSFSLGG